MPIRYHAVTRTALKSIPVIGLALAVSFLVSPGALIQQSFVNLFDPNLTTIYNQVYGDSIVRFTGVSAWLLQAFHPLFLVISVAVAAVSVTARSIRALLLRLWLSVASVLTATDVVLLLIAHDLSATAVLENVFSNTIGGAVLAFFLTLVLAAVQAFLRPYSFHLWQQHLVASMALSVSGVLGSIAAYFVVIMFLHPLPVHVRIVATAPLSGAIGHPKSNPQSDTSDFFSVVPTNAKLDHVTLGLMSPDMSFGWQKTAGDDTTFTLELYPTSECLSGSPSLEEISGASPSWQLDDISHFSLSVVGGRASFLTINGEQLRPSFVDGPVELFWITPDTPAESLTVTRFLNEDTHASADTSGDIALHIAVPAFDTNGTTTKLVERSIAFNVGGRELRMSFSPLASLRDDHEHECRVVTEWSTLSSAELRVEEQAAPGAFVRLLRTDKPARYYSRTDGRLSLEHATGWFELPGLKPDSFRRAPPGRARLAVFDRSIVELVIDGSPQPGSLTQRFVGRGELDASYLHDARLLVAGLYTAAWLDDRRLNQTRWEATDGWFKATVGTLSAALFLALARLASQPWALRQKIVPTFWSP